MTARESRLAVAFARQLMRTTEGSLCGACVEVLGVSGAGITLLGGHEAGPICVSNERSRRLEDVQFLLGEGPCEDAFRRGVPVHAPDLREQSVRRWPVFTAEATAVGVEAVFAYPLSLDAASVGVLTLYQEHPGDLTASQNADCLELAAVVTATIMQVQAETAPGQVPPEFDDAVAHRAELHQASGMVAVQMDVRVGEALAVLRAYAFSNGRSVGEVAADVIARRVRFSNRDG